MTKTAHSPRTSDAAFDRAVQQHLAGHTAVAADLYRQALDDDPSHTAAANNLGAILAARGQRAEAEALFRRATSVEPDYGEALNNLGILLAEGGDHDEANRCFERATALEPGRAGWHNNHGNTLIELFRFPDAVAAFDRAIALSPDDADVWSNRGIALRGMREEAEAIRSLARAVELDPSHLNALSNLGVVLKEARRYDDATRAFERAITVAPDNAAILANFASVFERTGEHDRVRHWAQRAIDADPGYAESWNLLANVAMESGNFAEAEALYERVRSTDPENRNANWNLALLWLLQGDFVRGWPQFEWRKRLQSVVFDHGDYGPNAWQGDPLDGRTILLHSEQGIGDAIQFVRYAPVLKDRGAGRVVVEAPFPIVPLLAAARGVDAVVARGAALPRYDVHANLMSLPGLVGTTIETVPADIPYLDVEPRATSALVAAPPDRLKVGIVWAGNPGHARDFLRSAPLTAFADLARVPGTAFFSLQKGAEPERQLAQLPGRTIEDLAPGLVDFRDTAAAIQALDLVITVDTSVAHLAGALGVPTWLLLPHVPDFRWMLDRTDSPWYPSMRLFRQPTPRDWASVFAEVERELAKVATERVPAAAAAAAPIDIVTVTSTHVRDGRPFDVWVPLAELADERMFAEYEAELTGRAAHAEVRAFLVDLLQPGDALVDAAPGLGLVSVDVAASSVCSLRIVGEHGATARIGAMVSRRAPAARWSAYSSVSAATALPADGRLVVRLADTDVGTLRALFAAGAAIADVVVCDTTSSVAGVREFMEQGMHVFALSTVDGEVTLDPWTDGGSGALVAMSPMVLAALTAGEVPHQEVPETAHVPAPAAVPDVGSPTVGIDWELRSDTGWGIYGTNLALELLKDGRATPVVRAVGPMEVSPLVAARLAPLFAPAAPAAPDLVLCALGNRLAGADSFVAPAARRAGVVFFEDTVLGTDADAIASRFDLLVAGSTWNAEVLAANGIAHVVTVPQGIDPSIFHPAPRSGLFADRFVVFSGGKLEYRKGQDIVVAAFRRFVATHPDALLVAAWHNAWPQLIGDLDLAGHVEGLPQLNGDRLDLVPWLARNGVPAMNVIDVGRQPNAVMGQLVREADVALFPNRAEGGTNLVAMECMAAGVPTILAANTGHLDLVATGGCQPLTTQLQPPRPTRYFDGIEGWGESDVDEVVAALETAYTDRAAMCALAARGADAMTRWTWHHQVGALLDALTPLC
ncbi:MAG: tetratricopeptide repeat protein [Gemmatimonadaceae bacterium]|nr:tetratricopeptide repeat protein [Gemmatimonadaceae bacterium]